jgi:hypothetical protein
MRRLYETYQYASINKSLDKVIQELELEDQAIYSEWAPGWELRLLSLRKTKRSDIYRFEVWGKFLEAVETEELITRSTLTISPPPTYSPSNNTLTPTFIASWRP